MKPPALEIQNLSHSFEKGNYILENINLIIKTGEIISILGSSGCGKTTLLRIIAGLEKQTRGTLKINDKVISDENYSTPPEKRNVGLVVQDRALFPHLTVYENVNFGIRNSSNINETPHEFLKLFKVENIQTEIIPRTIDMDVEYMIIPKSSDKTVDCKNSGNNDLRGPFKLQKLREKQRSKAKSNRQLVRCRNAQLSGIKELT